MLLAVAGCGYRMETEGLPGNAHSLGIGRIRNLTHTGELDVRLRTELRRRLARNPSFRLTPPERAELQLEVALTRLRVTRPLDVSDTDLSSLRYVLGGVMTVFRRMPERKQIMRRKVNAMVRLDFDRAVIETAAVRDELDEDVIIEFAGQIVQTLYRHF